jgi:hypothetical protein
MLCDLFPVATDGLDRTTFHRLFAEGFLLGRLGLLVYVGVPTVVVPFEVRRRRLAAQVTIDALVVDVKSAEDVLRIAVGCVSHVSDWYFLGTE